MATREYRADIDGLRALAVSSVVAFHAGLPGFTGGFLGVDIFFVLSGFLITSILHQELLTYEKINLWNFYAKRFKRLYPSLLTVIVFCLLAWIVLLWLFGSYGDTKGFVESTRYSILGIANIYFSENVGGYFHHSSEEMPFLHLWSLAVEEQFYFVWTYLLILSKKKLNISLIFLTLISLLFSEYLISQKQTNLAFYLMPSRLWELSIGGLIGINFQWLKKKNQFISSFTSNVISISAILVLFASIFSYSNETRFPGFMATPIVISTSMLLVFGWREGFVNKVLTFKPIVKIGLLSYGWYLWHWPLLAFSRTLILGEEPSLLVRLGCCSFSLFLSYLSLRFIENPVRFGEYFNKLDSKWIVKISFLVSLFIFSLSYTILPLEKKIGKQHPYEIIKMIEEKPFLDERCKMVSSDTFEFCSYNLKRKNAIYVWGDSHTYAMTDFYKKLADFKSYDFILRSHSALIPLLDLKEIYQEKKQVPYEIENQNNLIFEDLKKQLRLYESVEVILSARWPAYVGVVPISVKDSRNFLGKSRSISQSLIIFQNKLRQTIKKIQLVGVSQITILLPPPEFKFEIKRCFDKDRCLVSRQKMEDYQSSTKNIIYKISNELNVKVIDPINYFCDSKECRQVINNNLPVVYDDDHLTCSASRYLGEKVIDSLKNEN
jgi:peptidoglycan/LPS O-acetylase OafA/YrhL